MIHLRASDAAKLGLTAKSRPAKAKLGRDERQLLFLAACEANDLPVPIPEYRFAPPRKWRMDWAWLYHLVYLEIQGGCWTGGRHTRGAALQKEWEKLNEAAICGWRCIFCSREQVRSGSVFITLRKVLGT